jgi:hypothetical protein
MIHKIMSRSSHTHKAFTVKSKKFITYCGVAIMYTFHLKSWFDPTRNRDRMARWILFKIQVHETGSPGFCRSRFIIRDWDYDPNPGQSPSGFGNAHKNDDFWRKNVIFIEKMVFFFKNWSF